MRIAYIAPLPIDFKKLGGVEKKICSHVEYLSKYFETLLFYYCDGKVYVENINKKKKDIIGFAKSKLGLLLSISRYCKKEGGISGVYCRYPGSDFFFLKLLKALKKKNIRIVIEIPTYPYDKEGDGSIRSKVIKGLDRFFRRHLSAYVDRIVTFSDDNVIFGIKTIKTINGINFDGIEISRNTPNVTDCINLVAVSAMFKVHGYERLILGLKNYYSFGGKRNFRLLLVGDGVELPEYTALTERYKLQNHVFVLGPRYGNDLERVYQNATVGVNSLAIHRQGLIRESTLKSREYAAYGLPIISSSYVDAFSKSDNEKFVFRIPSDESPVDVFSLVEFVDAIYESKDYLAIHEKIRSSAMGVCGFKETFKNIISFFEPAS